MNQGTDEGKKTAAIDAVIARVRERCPPATAEQIGSFVRDYFAGVAPEDITARCTSDLYGAALSHWGLGCTRKPGQPLMHVYNPDPEQHSWESNHTIVEIVTDDMPFLVDSLTMALNRLGLTIHLIIHPVLTVQREQQGQLHQICEPITAQQTSRHEAWMHFEIDRQTEPATLQAIHRETAAALTDVRVAVEDWQPMRAQLDRAIRALRRSHLPVERDDLAEILEFLRWLRDDHFTFLGYRRYDLRRSRTGDELRAIADSGLGLLRQASGHRISSSFAVLPEDVRSRARDPEPLILTKSNSRSPVHRPSYLDYIGIKRYDQTGEVIGEHRFFGLFTSLAYNHSSRAIPLLRRKVARILERAKLRPNSHAGKALANILETYPRDELFQASIDELFDLSLSILQLQERQRVRLLVRYDAYRRFVSCLVFTPRERYNTQVRERMQAILQAAFGGSQTEFRVQLSESKLARVHFIVRLTEPGRPEYQHAALEQELADTLRSWADNFAEALRNYYGEEIGNHLFNRYGNGFNAAYREDTSPTTATHDVERLETLQRAGDLATSLYRPLEAAEGLLRFKLFHAERPVSLSDVLPLLENMGVRVIDERPYAVKREGGITCWIDDFGLCCAGTGQLETERIHDIFQNAFAAIWHHQAENDGFNRLVLAAELGWRDIVILRAYAKYLRQAGTAFSQRYIEDTLVANPQITLWLIELFKSSFNPCHKGKASTATLVERIKSLLEEVASLDQDRILRRLLAAVQATVRTNYFCTDSAGNALDYLCFKLQPRDIPSMPKPVPAYEIYVYSPRVEGVHLRGGKVARGGVRWSERREDFRTEILGLMKAQMVKNAVIVPVGAKGGFVCKRLPEDRQTLPMEVQACYRIFIRGLLDVTDNIIEGRVAPPPKVVCYDNDGPYLVVAADKGTARFSDLANEIAYEYGFWLRDAFASGGSTGYDHKKMGITARGGWEAVKRHFRELDRDVHKTPFTAIGIGDMSGDVFGNGMLCSRQLRLIAAFDHRHIFIDPNPDTAASYQERQRLFALERSSWADYDRTVISAGGGVWSRTAKAILLPPEARAALAISAERLTPNELISTILRAPVDLLWNGGIGTYVKASTESHADAGDKANDAVRIDACELRCQVIGEGGNLGFTQRGRVEFALAGGRINTDAIDNSGGVDCSDHEVNIKILLNRVVDEGELTLKQRNRLLVEMTEDVAGLVLHDNYHQTQGLTLSQARAPELLDEHNRFMHELERSGHLDRRVEQLPDNEGVAERQKAGLGLTRPELAVLQAYAKIDAYEALLHAAELHTAYFADELKRYFPAALRERFPDPVANHPLRAEITATLLANHIVNHMGSTFLFRIRAQTGVSAMDAAQAYFAARDVYGLRGLWRAINQLDNQVPAQLQTRMLLRLSDLQERATLWLLRNLQAPIDIQETVARIRPAIDQFTTWLDALLPELDCNRLHAETAELIQAGVSQSLAHRIGYLGPLYPVLDLVKVCAETKATLERAAHIYFSIATQLELNWLRDTLAEFEVVDPWQERYRAGLEDEFYVQLRLLTMSVLTTTPNGQSPEAQVAYWAKEYETIVMHLRRTLNELQSAPQVDLAMLGVAIQELRTPAHAGTAQQLWLTRKLQPEAQRA